MPMAAAEAVALSRAVRQTLRSASLLLVPGTVAELPQRLGELVLVPDHAGLQRACLAKTSTGLGPVLLLLAHHPQKVKAIRGLRALFRFLGKVSGRLIQLTLLQAEPT